MKQMNKAFFSSSRVLLLLIGLIISGSGIAGCLTPPTGMVGWWPGDGNAKDLIAHHDGVYSGAFTAGEVGQAFAIQGSNNAVTIANDPSFESAQVSVDAWVRSNQPSDYKWIVAKGASNCDSASYGLYTSGQTNDIRFIIYDGSTFGVAQANVANIWNNQWHFVAGTYDGAVVNLYVDGALVASQNFSLTINYNLPTTNDLTIGRYVGCTAGSNNYAFTGDIDEVEIFNRAITAAEVQAIYHAGSAGKCKFTQISIMVKPGDDTPCVNPNSKGVVPVALLGAANFDVNNVNVSTLKLNGLTVRVRGGKPLCHVDNVNNDAFPDLVCQFDNSNSAWPIGTTAATLTGTLNDGTPIQGQANICLVPVN